MSGLYVECCFQFKVFTVSDNNTGEIILINMFEVNNKSTGMVYLENMQFINLLFLLLALSLQLLAGKALFPVNQLTYMMWKNVIFFQIFDEYFTPTNTRG